MKISDRDKKILLIVILLAVILLPIFLWIKPTNEKIVDCDSQIAKLDERLAYLKDLDAKRPFYEDEIDRLQRERTALIDGFASGIKQENTIMFLRDIELNFPISMSTESFSGNILTPVTNGYTDENGNLQGDLTAVKSSTTVSYACDYDQFKQLLEFIFNYDTKMAVPTVSAKLNADTFRLEGTFVFDEYAFIGSGRSVDSVSLPELKRGENDSVFYAVYGIEIPEEETSEEVNEETVDETEE